jgi:hypothetical protein
MPYKDPLKRIEQRKRYRKDNSQKLNEYKRLYFIKNPEKLKAYYQKKKR